MTAPENQPQESETRRIMGNVLSIGLGEKETLNGWEYDYLQSFLTRRNHMVLFP